MTAGTAPALAKPEGGFFRPRGSQLVEHGYDVVPIKPGTKSPGIRAWVERDFNHESTRAWHGHGVGVKTGRPNSEGQAVIGVDIDVLDPVIATRLVAWCRESIGDAPLRVGQPPKTMLVFRTSNPFGKKRSRIFRSPDACKHAVEVLGKGQQFLAYAIHPVTGQPYTWDGSELADTPITELPEITEQQALDFIALFESIVPPDWEPVTRESIRRDAGKSHNTSKTPRAPIWELRVALAAIPIPPGDPRDEWIKIGMALYHATEGSAEGLALWGERSSKGEKYEAGEPERLWKGFARQPGGHYLSAATLFGMADKVDPSWRGRAREQERVEYARKLQGLVDRTAAADAGVDDADDAHSGDVGDLTPLKTVSMADLAGKAIPERKWIVEGLVPDRNVTDLSGDGGLGKSQAALQLGVAVATGSAWLGYRTSPGGVLYLSAEDELDEIQRRTEAIAKSEGMSLVNLGNLHIADLTTGIDTELVLPDRENRQSVVTTPQFARLEARIATLQPKLVILDTRADMFGGNEIDRVQVRTFIRRLRDLCLSYGMAILLLSHPSRTGLTTGDGQSGSTAWGNSVRSRLYLKRHADDPDLRVLTSEKSNYGPTATEITLRWENGVFRRVDTLVDKVPDREAMWRHVDERFIQHLADVELRGDRVNNSPTGKYAPRIFSKLDAPSPDRIGEKAYEASMYRLMQAGRLKLVPHGAKSKEQMKLVAVDPTSPLQRLAQQQEGTADVVSSDT